MSQDTEGSPEMAHNVLGLGVVVRFLMELLDSGHLLPCLAHQDGVDNMNSHPPDGELRRLLGDQLRPPLAKLSDAERTGVEEPQQIVVFI